MNNKFEINEIDNVLYITKFKDDEQLVVFKILPCAAGSKNYTLISTIEYDNLPSNELRSYSNEITCIFPTYDNFVIFKEVTERNSKETSIEKSDLEKVFLMYRHNFLNDKSNQMYLYHLKVTKKGKPRIRISTNELGSTNENLFTFTINERFVDLVNEVLNTNVWTIIYKIFHELKVLFPKLFIKEDPVTTPDLGFLKIGLDSFLKIDYSSFAPCWVGTTLADLETKSYMILLPIDENGNVDSSNGWEFYTRLTVNECKEFGYV